LEVPAPSVHVAVTAEACLANESDAAAAAASVRQALAERQFPLRTT
jgi:hypothetical protein